MKVHASLKGDPDSVIELFHLINGFGVSQAIHVPATLGFVDLLASNGFRLTRVIKTWTGPSLIEAEPVFDRSPWN
jgi:hypothetical protein